MIARQCSSCGGFCGGGFNLNGKYYFCKQLKLSELKK